MPEHVVKSWPESFQPVWDGLKAAEFRRDDRGFEVGDQLTLVEWRLDLLAATGRQILARIAHIVRGPDFEIPVGFALLSLADLQRTAPPPSASLGIRRPR